MSTETEAIEMVSLAGESVVYYDRAGGKPLTAIVTEGQVRADTLLPIHGDRVQLVAFIPNDGRLAKTVVPMSPPAMHISDPNRHSDPMVGRSEDPRCWDYSPLMKRILLAVGRVEAQAKEGSTKYMASKGQKAEEARIAREAAAAAERERQAASDVPRPPGTVPIPGTVPQPVGVQE